MKRNIIYFLLIISLLFSISLSSCGSQAAVLHKQSTYKYINSSLEISKKIKALTLNIDSGNIQIFCWDKPEIKYEIKHTVRDIKTVEQLEMLIEEFSTETAIKDNTCSFNINYHGKIKNPKDIFSDVKLTIPRRIKQLNITQDQGNLTVEDKYEGNVDAELNTVNSEIKSMNGNLLLACKKGNVRLNSGKLLNGSDVKVETGSIYIKTECQDKAKYSFETNTGNLELAFPVTSSIKLDAFGTITNNQFTGVDGSINIQAKTKIGKISVSSF